MKAEKTSLRISSPDSETLILSHAFSLKWSVGAAIVGTIIFGAMAWYREASTWFSVVIVVCLWLVPLIGIVFPLREQPTIVFSQATQTLRRFPFYRGPWKGRNNLELPFANVKEFLIEPETWVISIMSGEMPPELGSPWHLLAICDDGVRFELICDDSRDVILDAASRAAQFTEKPFHILSDPMASERWKNWGANFVQ